MRSIDDQLTEIVSRGKSVKLNRLRRRAAVSAVCAAAACFAVIAALAAGMSAVTMSRQAVYGGPSFGSLVLTGPALPYILIGSLAFLFGVSFTLLCIHVRERNRGRK